MTRRDIPIFVSLHARVRALDRFAPPQPDGFKPARICDEVRAAFEFGRFGITKPPGIAPPDDPNTLYAWTENGERVYALRPEYHRFVVKTTMKTEAP